jgi:superfamily II DNA or RNA helicase
MQLIPAATIIAEALVAVPDALLTALRPGDAASGASVATRLARSLSPAEHPVHPPSWLFPSQGVSFRRVLAAVNRYRGALLADPVGSGKTFVALAVAAQVNSGSTACLVPAALLPQWQVTAARLGIAVTLWSHERISRGQLPEGTRGLVIIDESHRFRNSGTQRYRYLAPWLVGRSALLLTATPVVNRVADLAHQLLLAVRDDALAADGVTSLHTLLRKSCSSPALGQLVFENRAGLEPRPQRVHRQSKADESERSAAARAVAAVDRLRLSKSDTIAGLIRGVLLRAAASSPAAFRQGLRRYHKLLLHARDAVSTGRPIDRNELRRFTRGLDDQLVWWELLPITKGHSELELEDTDPLEATIHELEATALEPDSKLGRLRFLLTDGTPSLVFTASRPTVRHIRHCLADLQIAWCTGNDAGIGRTPLPRHTVLAWFRAPGVCDHAPRHLVVTDVAAEGLDLQRVARVVHYDLPWTPMRMEQREGRAVRYGSQHPRVEVVRFGLPPVLERRLRLCATLTRKQRLPAAAGLGDSGRHLWQWRAELASRFPGRAIHGVAAVPSALAGVLAGFALYAAGDSRALSVTVLWMDNNGSWTEAPEIVEARLESAATQQGIVQADPAELANYLTLLAGPVRERLALTRGRRWIVPDPTASSRRVLVRLQSYVREAARRHDTRRMTELERAMALAAGGLTAGEAALMDRLAKATDPDFNTLVRTLPARGSLPEQLEVKLTGLVLFGPAKISQVTITSPECADSKPCCSISTEP